MVHNPSSLTPDNDAPPNVGATRSDSARPFPTSSSIKGRRIALAAVASVTMLALAAQILSGLWYYDAQRSYWTAAVEPVEAFIREYRDVILFIHHYAGYALLALFPLCGIQLFRLGRNLRVLNAELVDEVEASGPPAASGSTSVSALRRRRATTAFALRLLGPLVIAASVPALLFSHSTGRLSTRLDTGAAAAGQPVVHGDPRVDGDAPSTLRLHVMYGPVLLAAATLLLMVGVALVGTKNARPD